MEGLFLHQVVTFSLLGSMIAAFFVLASGHPAPYGRYYKHKSLNMEWKVLIPARLAWCAQEAPALAVPLLFVLRDADAFSRLPMANQLLLIFFAAHYFNRAVVYPLRIRGGKPTPLGVAASAFCFCLVNGWLQAWYLTHVPLPQAWHRTPCFVAGVSLFCAGAAANVDADSRLRALRKYTTDGEYAAPNGGLFRFVSGANFLAECLEWFGFAVAADFSYPAVAFAACCLLNLGPRAKQHHDWYRTKFEDYPKHRKAFIPFVY